jgi:antitoxin MazE
MCKMTTTVKTKLVKIGNSQGIRIPKPILEQLGLTEDVELEILADQLIVRSAHPARYGWERQFQAMAAASDDRLLDEEVLTPTDWDHSQWVW